MSIKQLIKKKEENMNSCLLEEGGIFLSSGHLLFSLLSFFLYPRKL